MPLLVIGIAIQSAASLEKFFPHYVNATVAEDIQRAYEENRLFRPGAPRFLPIKEQISSTAQNASYTVRNLREYLNLRSGDYNSLLESKLIENAPDIWFFYVWLSVGWKIRLIIIAIVVALAAGACFFACQIYALATEREVSKETSS